jgi:hypothetical protein
MQLSGQRMRRYGALGVVGATALVAACDTTLSFRPNELLWGFVSINAVQNSSNQIRTAPTAVFFRGEVSAVPSASLRPDSCFPSQAFTPSTNSFTGVTYLDAGANVSLSLGGQLNALPRVSNGGITSYNLAAGSALAYTPGDSTIIAIPGANGGYPQVELRARTAEAFTLQPLVPPRTGYMPLRWTRGLDTNSAIIIQLTFAPAGGSGNISREYRCAFRDDGIDSIPVTAIPLWTDSTNLKREFIATRLRTILRDINGGAIQFISTYQIPTPRL